jgi:hypothetical protein
MRSSSTRTPLALAFFVVLSGACGGDDDEAAPAEYASVPGPTVPQPPAQRSLSAEGAIDVTPASGQATSATLVTKVSAGVYAGRESGYTLRMECGDTVASVDVALYFPQGDEIILVERRANRWEVDDRPADVVSMSVVDAGADAASDASAPSSDPAIVNGVGLPDGEGRREIAVALRTSDGVRYEIRATVPWLASVAPATCQERQTSTATTGSTSRRSSGCGSGSSSNRRSSGGDWD